MNLQLLDKIPDKHIIVVGDVMLDRYTIGSVERQSPEAPVSILAGKETYSRLGGAANVALNIKTLGAKATILGVVGKDHAATDFKRICNDEGIEVILLEDETRRTTVKHRFISDKKHLLRVDDEDLHNIGAAMESELSVQFQKLLPSCTGVILSDYNKGTLTPHLIEQLLEQCSEHGVPVYVDPKFHNFELYQGVEVFKPNVKELRAALADQSSSLADLLVEIRNRLNCRAVVCTLASEGIAYNTALEADVCPTEKIDIVDVSGAGDTVMAVICLTNQCRMPIEDSCELSNRAGKLVCMQSGVVSISLQELKNEVHRPSADKKNK